MNAITTPVTASATPLTINNSAVAALKILFGVVFGFSLSRIGFSNYDELHKMFVFADLRMFLTFAGGLVLATLLFKVVSRGRFQIRRPIHKGSILGGVLFGTGWALAGGCPSVPLVQLGEGKVAALFTIGGIVSGMVLFRWLQSRYLRWDVGSCGE
jgi:uncharacterized membrane protein YedE/YeeE